MFRRLFFVVAVGASVVAAWEALGALVADPSRAHGQPPNIVLVSFDSLRADHLGCYGYSRDTSPQLDRFAAQGIVFENAYSTSTWTLPAHASLLSSLYPEEHGARGLRQRIADRAVLLPERLATAGYATAGVVSVGLLHRVFGFDRGWSVYDDVTAVARGEDPERRRTSEVVGRRAAELLDELAPGPFFLFVHDYDVHFDYQPPPPFDTRFEPVDAPGFDPSNFAFNETVRSGMPELHRQRLVALYDGEIAWVDHNFGLLLGELERRGLSENTVVVVVGDHGDEFFEHGARGHGNNVYNTTLHVPLIVRLLQGAHAGSRVDARVSLVDVAPTLAALAGVAPEQSWSGTDLLPLVGDDAAHAAPRWVFAELETPRGYSERAAMRGRIKGISRFSHGELIGHGRRLFDLVADPEEQNSIGKLRPQRMSAISQLLAATSAEFWQKQVNLGRGATVVLDRERAAELRALGYL